MKSISQLFSLLILAAITGCGGSGGSTNKTPQPSGGTTEPIANPSATLLAGSYFGAGNANGPLATANINAPAGMVIDRAGNMYIVDSSDKTIRQITPSGIVSTYAGTPGRAGAVDGSRESARFENPIGLAIDKADNLYVSDIGNNLIRKITANGNVSTLAGIPSEELQVINGPALTARFAAPWALAVDSKNNVFVIEQSGRLRKISADGNVSTVAGPDQLFQSGFADGTGSTVRFSSPKGIAIDNADNVYIADTGNGTIRKLSTTGIVSTFAGRAGAKGFADGPLASASFYSPRSIRFDKDGNLFVVDSVFNYIRKISSTGIVSTIAGMATETGGYVNANGNQARFDFPRDLTVDSTGNLYISDLGNFAVRKITPEGAVSTWLGQTSSKGTTDGTGTAARFNTPTGLVYDGSGNFYIADTGNHTIRKVSTNGVVTTFAGTPGSSGFRDAIGSSAQFTSPTGLAIDSNGNLFVADRNEGRIRKITPTGVVSTFAGGTGNRPGTDGPANVASFDMPYGLIFDANNYLIVTDLNQNSIRRISPSGQVTTVAGSIDGLPGTQDGVATAARFYCPSGVTIDKSGNLYVADYCNHTIRKISPTGLVTTYAGRAGESGNANGDLNSARFSRPSGLTIDENSNLYVAEQGTSTIRKITPAGVVSTVAGVSGIASLVPDKNSKTLAYPENLSFDKTGKLFATMNNGIFQINF